MRLSEIMSPALLNIDPGLDVGFASRLMRRFGIRHLPVLDGGELVGILSYPDVLRLFDLLRRVPFFESLSVEDLIALLRLSSLRRCPRGHVLVEEGDAGRELFLVQEGEMVVSTRRAGRIARIRAGELFGEMELFGGQRSATVRAVVDSWLVVIDGEKFLELADSRPHLGAVVFESMSRLLSQRLRHANRFLFLRGIWTHRASVLRVMTIGVIAFVTLVLGTAMVAETPSLCQSCHLMRPYYSSWSTSPHREVSCTKCHWTYGLQGAARGKITGLAMVVRYVTGTYNPKPEAKVEDTSCLRSGCHSDSVRAPRFRTAAGRDVRFDHSAHERRLKDVGALRCTSCHSHRGQDAHFSVSPEVCSVCHFPASEKPPTPCLGCHDFEAPVEGAPVQSRVNHAALSSMTDCLACHRNVTSGSGAVEKSRCSNCHLRPGSLPTATMHRVHVVDEDVDCFDCHAVKEHPGPAAEILAGRCEACHADPHVAQERLYLGKGGVGVPQRSALMFYYHVECTACHQSGIAGADSALSPAHAGGAQQVCLECHDITAEDRARMWKTTIERLRTRVRGALVNFERLSGPGGAAGLLGALRLYEEARLNYEIVAADPSASIHNFRYAKDLLEASQKKITEAISLFGASKGGTK